MNVCLYEVGPVPLTLSFQADNDDNEWCDPPFPLNAEIQLQLHCPNMVSTYLLFIMLLIDKRKGNWETFKFPFLETSF